jgi:hypothetical protein
MIVLIPVVAFLLAIRVHKLTEGVYTLKLVGGCYLDCHTPSQAVGLP